MSSSSNLTEGCRCTGAARLLLFLHSGLLTRPPFLHSCTVPVDRPNAGIREHACIPAPGAGASAGVGVLSWNLGVGAGFQQNSRPTSLLQETANRVTHRQQLVQFQLPDELEEADDDWDEWQEEEEEEEDPDELRDAGVRQELVVMLEEFLSSKRVRVGGRWEQEPAEPEEHADQGPRRFHPVPDVVVAKTPTCSPTLDALQRQNNAPQLCHSLKLFLHRRNPNVRPQEIRQLVPPTMKVHTWSCARLFHAPPPFKPSEGLHINAVRAQPVKLDCFERVSRPARFDTVLIRSREHRDGVHRYRPARVRAIFQLPRRIQHLCDEKLAHVKLFNSPSQNPNPPVGLFTTTRSIHDGIRSTLVIPLVDIAMTCHLAPRDVTREPTHGLPRAFPTRFPPFPHPQKR
ncbi:hypothetical protein RhiJN_16451 [Ceratobasidium sp. AG-Ba]|nr:hypothetical protein RhiJN_16451 [Ceratobasidium sp. AG-Ba]